MSTTLVINVAHGERRVALTDKGSLSELYIERSTGRGLVGNIYKGKVVRVLPGMDAAFVDVSLEKAGFLYISDVAKPVSASDLGLAIRDGSDEEGVDGALPSGGIYPGGDQPPRISDLLHNGQEILVQVAKAPIGTKGAR